MVVDWDVLFVSTPQARSVVADGPELPPLGVAVPGIVSLLVCERVVVHGRISRGWVTIGRLGV